MRSVVKVSQRVPVENKEISIPTSPIKNQKKVSELEATRRIILSELSIKDFSKNIKEAQELLVSIKNFIDNVRSLEEYEHKEKWCDDIFAKIKDFQWEQAKEEVSEILYKWGRFLLDNGRYKKGLQKFWEIYEKFEGTRWFLPVFDELVAREQPKNMVFIHIEGMKPFFMDIYLVKNSDYLEFMRATNAPAPNHWKGNMYPIGKGNHPVTWISFHDAEKYAAWNNKRLPFEDEWQKAAEGPNNYTWTWGDMYERQKCNCAEIGHGDTSAVGKYTSGKSHYGCFDMCGNVWEWTNSWYSNDKVYKVLRGGSWYTYKEYTTTKYRYFDIPTNTSGLYGFRCIKSFEK